MKNSLIDIPSGHDPGFYAYIRGQTDDIPAGYTEAGLRVYRYLVYLGAAQMVQAHYPDLRSQLGEDNWQVLIEAFVRQSAWQSNFYEDLIPDFHIFLQKMAEQ